MSFLAHLAICMGAASVASSAAVNSQQSNSVAVQRSTQLLRNTQQLQSKAKEISLVKLDKRTRETDLDPFEEDESVDRKQSELLWEKTMDEQWRPEPGKKAMMAVDGEFEIFDTGNLYLMVKQPQNNEYEV